MSAAAGATRSRFESLRTHIWSAAGRRLCSSGRERPERVRTSQVRCQTGGQLHTRLDRAPDPLSNLRPIVYHVPDRESELERRLRHLRQETEDWNHDFWTRQNISFSKEKENFITSHFKAKGLTVRDQQGHRRSLTSEEMAVFYKSFLDKNRARHANYNKEWYRRNFAITLLMARVALNNMWRTVGQRST